MNKLALLIFAAALVTVAAPAQDEMDVLPAYTSPPEELVPETNLAFAAGGENFLMLQVLRQKLPVIGARDVKFGVIAQTGNNGLEPDYAVMVTEDAGSKFAIAADVLSQPLWKSFSVRDLRMITYNTDIYPRDKGDLAAFARTYGNILDAVETRAHDVVARHCRIAIDRKRADRISWIWQAMLMEARYHYFQGDADLDREGTDYHFAGQFDCGYFCYSQTLMAHAVSPGGKKPSRLVSLGEAMRDYCLADGKTGLDRLDSVITDLTARLPPEG